jgi:hypothetical protein
MFALAPQICRAQDAIIQPVPFTQRDVILVGRPGNDNILIGRITLLSNKALPELLFRPSDLERKDGAEVISRLQIQPVSSVKLSLVENTPQDFDFKVSGLKTPGIYIGTIDFLLPRLGTAAAIHLGLRVQAEEVPKVSLRKGSDSLKIQIINCSPLRCFVGKRLFKDGLLENYSFLSTMEAYSRSPSMAL